MNDPARPRLSAVTVGNITRYHSKSSTLCSTWGEGGRGGTHKPTDLVNDGDFLLFPQIFIHHVHFRSTDHGFPEGDDGR